MSGKSDEPERTGSEPETDPEVPAPLWMKVVLTATPFLALVLFWLFHRWWSGG